MNIFVRAKNVGLFSLVFVHGKADKEPDKIPGILVCFAPER